MRKLLFWQIAAGLAVVSVIFCGGAFLLEGGPPACEPAIQKSVAAPDRTLTLVVFEMGCGATAPFNTQATLVPGGQAFVPQRDQPFLIIEGRYSLLVEWDDAKTARITVPTEAKLYRQERTVGAVTVNYR